MAHVAFRVLLAAAPVSFLDSIAKPAPLISFCQVTESNTKNSASGPKNAVSAMPVDAR
jgi:hypothetical protein